MAGRAMARTQQAMIERLGEEEVFAMYLEVGGTKELQEALGRRLGLKNEDGEDKPVSRHALYRWLQASPERQREWSDILEYQTTIWREEMIDIADRATNESERKDSLRVRAREASIRVIQKSRENKATERFVDTLESVWALAVRKEQERRDAEQKVIEADWEPAED